MAMSWAVLPYVFARAAEGLSQSPPAPSAVTGDAGNQRRPNENARNLWPATATRKSAQKKNRQEERPSERIRRSARRHHRRDRWRCSKAPDEITEACASQRPKVTRKITRLQNARLLAPASLSDGAKELWYRTIRDPDFVGFGPTVTRRLLSSYCKMTDALGEFEARLAQNKLLLPANRQEAASETIERVFEPDRKDLAETKSRFFKRKR
jgi:hypothetical protein